MAEDGCKLFVYGVDQNMENGDLSAEFEKCGQVTDVYNTGKGFAFVTFSRFVGNLILYRRNLIS